MSGGYIIYVLAAVGVFTVYMAILHVFKRDTMRERLGSFATLKQRQEEERTPLLALLCGVVLSLFGIDPRAQRSNVLLLQQAGISSPHAVVYFVFIKRIVQPVLFVGGLLLFARVAFLGGLDTNHRMQYLMWAAVLAFAGYFGANVYIANLKQKRQKILTRGFPEMLDLLLVCIESGLGLDAALARVCGEIKRSHTSIAQELERTRIELTVMSDRTAALSNLADRTDIVPFKSLVAALVQTEKFGTSLVETLRVLSDEQRVTRLLNAENKAAKLPVFITIPLICCTLPALFIVVLGPPFIRISQQGGLFGSASSQ